MTLTPLNLRAHSVDDLIAVAPIVLRYHPKDDVVMLTAAGDHPFHGRAALPTAADPAPAALVAAQLLEPAHRNGLRAVVFLFFSDDVRTVRRVWHAVRSGCDRSGLAVVGAARVAADRYYPLQGERGSRDVGIRYDVSAHPFLAQAVLHGIVVAKDRGALAATTAPDPAACAETARALARELLDQTAPPTGVADRRRWGDWLQRVVQGHVAAGTTANPTQVARIAWATQDVRVRDAAWALIRRAEAEGHLDFWLDVTRRAPDRLRAAPAALLGWAAWQAGHGALAWIAVDRCREVAPEYSMAALLARFLEEAVPPDALGDGFAWDEGLPD
jgi:hypothetical protein